MIVIGNTWAILHDETVYPEPYTFQPERFLLDDGSPGGPSPSSRIWLWTSVDYAPTVKCQARRSGSPFHQYLRPPKSQRWWTKMDERLSPRMGLIRGL
ncbi:hypothetical protein B0H14DRAFT_315457 [Mycena olivaceomarginata]|nr:hypothetical protein B0H14DRAFT_315457 [Mycena olivaceomarginata]